MARGGSRGGRSHGNADRRQTTTSKRISARDWQTDSGGKVNLGRAELVCAAIVFVGALLLYCWTLAPTVTLTDSGELIVVAQGLGVAHPPGFPLWVMLAHLASLVPFGNVAMRVNFSSALFAALACAMLTLAVIEVIVAFLGRGNSKRTAQRTNRETQNLQFVFVFVPALGAGLLMAVSRTLWSYATVAEVYTLNSLVIITILFLMLRWRRCVIAETRDPRVPITSHDLWLYVAAFVFGLALGDHHVTVGLLLPALAIFVCRTQGLKFFASRRLLIAALISIGALVVVYSYLPFAASRSPVIDWGHPRSLQEIWWHITGRQYRVFFSFTPDIVGKQFLDFCGLVFHEFGWPWLPLALVFAFAGFVAVFKHDRTSFWFLLLIIVADLAYCLSYDIAEDKDAYYLPAFISIAIAAALGIRWLVSLTFTKSMSAAPSFGIAAIAVLLTCATAFAANWPFNNRRHYFIAQDYVENLFSTIEPNGLLLTLDWQVVSPAFYVQEVEHFRRDVKVIDINLLRRSWYFEYLRHAYPELIERSRQKIDAFVQILKEWEQDPAAFAGNDRLTQRISMAFLEMIQAIVRNESKTAPIYMTNDLLSKDSLNGELTRWIMENYQLVPQGLVFNLATDRGFQDQPEARLQTRGLADGTLRFEASDAVKLKVLPSYTGMLINRGRYLAMFNQHERAAAAFRDALALDPNLTMAKQGLAESRAKLRSP